MGELIEGRIFILGMSRLRSLKLGGEVMVQIFSIPPRWFLDLSSTMSMTVTSKCGTSNFS
jgi:hypothetical protein